VTESDKAPEAILQRHAELERQREARAVELEKNPPPATHVADAISRAGVPAKGELRGYAKLLAQLSSGDAEERKRARFALADDCRRNLHRHKRKPIPRAPVRLPPESVVLAILKKPQKSRGVTDRTSVRLLVGWRDAVYRAEHANEATLRALFEAITTFRDLELPGYSVEILDHLEVEFEIENVPARRTEWELERLCRDYRTLSSNLRRGAYERTHRRKKHPEDDDTAIQGEVRIPAPGSMPDPDDDVGDLEFP